MTAQRANPITSRIIGITERLRTRGQHSVDDEALVKEMLRH